MPSTTFTVASTSDHGRVGRSEVGVYPPTGTISSDSFIEPMRSYTSGDNAYYLRNGLLRFDTSSLPDNSSVTGVTLRLANTVFGYSSGDSRQLTIDWYPWDGTSTDYSETALTNAFAGRDILSHNYNTWNEYDLLNPDQYVSRTGYTYLRLHISGGQPTGQNTISFREFGSDAPPELIVTYTERTRLAPDAIAQQSGFSPAVTLSTAQTDPDA